MRAGLYNPRPVDDVPVNGQLTHGVTSNWAFDHNADLDAHIRSPIEILRTGEYIYTLGMGANAANIVILADRLYVIPFIVSRAMTFDRLATYVSAGDAGKVARIGIYNSGVNLYPSTLVVDAGEISVAAIAVVSAVIAQSLTKGLYWMAIVSDGVPTIAHYYPQPSPLGIWAANLQYVANAGWRVNLVYTAGVTTLPDPYTAGGVLLNSRIPAVIPRLLSLD